MARVYIPPQGEEKSGNLPILFWHTSRADEYLYMYNYVVMFNVYAVKLDAECDPTLCHN